MLTELRAAHERGVELSVFVRSPIEDCVDQTPAYEVLSELGVKVIHIGDNVTDFPSFDTLIIDDHSARIEEDADIPKAMVLVQNHEAVAELTKLVASLRDTTPA